ncbi:MAG: hypothetical protein IPO62_04635 [Saprospiraceae bacterium]|nr:hypothetical protein [Saprospiraceae bacterium]
MKNYIVLFLIVLSYNSFSQDTIRIEDIIKKSKRKYSSGMRVNNADRHISNPKSFDALASAIDPYVFKIETQYQLKKGEAVYGTDDSPYFGRTFGLGISMGKEIWVDPTLVKPWTVDPNFEEQRTEYDGQLYKVNLTAMTNGSVEELYSNKFSTKVNEIGFGTIEMKNRGFDPFKKTSDIKYSTMLILYYGKGDEPYDSLERKVVFVNPDLKNQRTSLPDLNDKDLLGGFLLEMVPQRGSILLQLVGMLVKSNANPNKMEIMCIFQNQTTGNEEPAKKSEVPVKSPDQPKIKPKEVGIHKNSTAKKK